MSDLLRFVLVLGFAMLATETVGCFWQSWRWRR